MWDSLSLLRAEQHNYLCPFQTEDKETVVCGVELVKFYISISFDVDGNQIVCSIISAKIDLTH